MKAYLPILALMLPAALPANGIQFDEAVIDAGFLVTQPVLVADLVDGQRQAVLAGRTEDHAQRLAVFAIDDPREPILEFEPGQHLIAFDVGFVGGRDQLFFIEPGRIMRYDFDDGGIVEFTAIRTIYGQQRSGELIPIDFVRDLNGDGLDDIVVPDTAGYRVQLQREDGTLADEVVLTGSSSMAVSEGRVVFRTRPLVAGDMTGDGANDLSVWRGNTLQVFPQLPDFRYAGDPDIVELGLGLQSEAELQAGSDGFGAVNQDGLVETRIWSVEDLNGDEVPDILTESTLNEGVFDKENDFRMHLGRLADAGVTFADTEDALIASSGLQYGLTTTDLNGDNRKDLLIRKVDMSFGRVMRALLSGNVPMELLVYKMREDDTYAESADFNTRTIVKISVRSGQVDIPAILVADLDNDGLKELLLQTDKDELSIQRGVARRKVFHDDAITHNVRLPRNGDLVASSDLNDDGRADLIIRYDESDGAENMKTVRLLFAAP